MNQYISVELVELAQAEEEYRKACRKETTASLEKSRVRKRLTLARDAYRATLQDMLAEPIQI